MIRKEERSHYYNSQYGSLAKLSEPGWWKSLSNADLKADDNNVVFADI